MLNPDAIRKTLKLHSFPHLNRFIKENKQDEESIIAEFNMLHIILNDNTEKEAKAESARRRSKRYPVDALCDVTTEEGTEKIFIQDISETGMRAKVLPSFYSLISATNEFHIMIPYKRIINGEWVEKKTECHARMIRLSEEKGSTLVCFDFFHKSEQDKKNLKEFITYYAQDEK